MLYKKKLSESPCQSPSGKTDDQTLYAVKEIRAISRINKATSALFQNQKTLPLGACHDVCSLSYDNHLYNKTRLNQSIESLFQNRKEAKCSALIHQKFSAKSHLGIKNFLKFLFVHNTLLSLHNTKTLQVLNKLLSCARILNCRIKLQFLLRKGYRTKPQ